MNTLTSIVTNYLKKQGYPYDNVVVTSRSGTSDIIACINGRYVAIEIKFRKDTTKLLQLHKQNQIIKSGGAAGIVRSLEDLKELERKVLSNEAFTLHDVSKADFTSKG